MQLIHNSHFRVMIKMMDERKVPRLRTDATMEGAEVSLLQDESWDDESVNVITYFLHTSLHSQE
jgi:hypothetical protein